jgi:hypothetical protein
MIDIATYRALVPIALSGGVCEPGELLIEGQNIPEGYIPPSGDCEPMNTAATWKYYKTTPRQSASRTISPKTSWQVTHYPTHDEWFLSGLGKSLSPICM